MMYVSEQSQVYFIIVCLFLIFRWTARLMAAMANRFPSTYLEYSGSVPLVYWQVAALLRDKDPPNRMHKTQVLNAVWFTGSLCAYWAHLSILCRLLRTQQHVTELCRMFALMLRWLEVLSDPSPTGTLLRLNPSCYDHFTQQWITRFRSEEN